MIGKLKSLKLFVVLAVIFAFAAFMQGCSSETATSDSGVPTGDSNKVAATGAEEVAVKTLLSFSQAVQKGDFQDFQQAQVAGSAKSELTTEKLNQTFAEFITNKTDISPKENAIIKYEPKPEMNDNSLNISGSYPGASGKTIEFKMQYVKDSGNWGLTAIEVKTS